MANLVASARLEHELVPGSPEWRVWEQSAPYVEEVRAADTVVVGTPMYNLTVPATLKLWIDRILLLRTFRKTITGHRVIVITARGGGYTDGASMAAYDYQEPYLRAILGFVGLAEDLTFVHAEMTMSDTDVELARYSSLAARTLARAQAAIEQHAASAIPAPGGPP
jgi:FMN-dependent NADH-azoreductase